MAKEFLHCRMGTHARVHVRFLRRVWCAFRQVFWAPCMRRCSTVCYTGVVCIIIHICVHTHCRMFICAYVCAVCSFSTEERGWGGSTRLWGHVSVAWRGELLFDRRKDTSRGVVCVFSIFNAGGSVCGCMCVYTRAHTHTAQMGYSVVNPGVGRTHLEGPENPYRPNLGIYIFVYVYKVHMCMYMLWSRRDEILD